MDAQQIPIPKQQHQTELESHKKPPKHVYTQGDEIEDYIYCQRHDLKLSAFVQHPQQKFSSQYKKAYRKISSFQKKVIPSPQLHSVENKTLTNFKTEYKDRYLNKGIIPDGKVKEKESETEQSAPMTKLTTYSTNFIGHHGANQYVPISRGKLSKSLKFTQKTSYSKNFTKPETPTVHFQPYRAQTNSGNISSKIQKRLLESTYKKQFHEIVNSCTEKSINTFSDKKSTESKQHTPQTTYQQQFKPVPALPHKNYKHFRIYQQNQIDCLIKRLKQ